MNIKMDKTREFISFGLLRDDKFTCPEGAGMLAIAWRCLYAEIVGARVEQRNTNMDNALKRAASMLHSRVLAYGEKWLKWRQATRNTSRAKPLAEKHTKYKLIYVDKDDATYVINAAIKDFIDFLSND